MTRKVQHLSATARRTAARSAVVAAGLVLAVGTAGSGQAAPVPTAARPGSAPACGATTTASSAATAQASGEGAKAEPTAAVTGNAGQKLSYSLAPEAPVGLWTGSSVTLRTPVSRGTVRLDVTTHGFSAASLMIQRYVQQTHRWVDLDTKPVGDDHPDSGVFTFPVSVSASPGHPVTVPLRVQDIDRPGTLSVAASVDDGRGHTYRAPVRKAVVDRPTVDVTGWPRGTSLVRGGAAKDFTLTVKNTTKRAYPALNASYFAYGQSGSHILSPEDLVLQEYLPGHGWQRLPLKQGSCDPGMSTRLSPTARTPLAPGATATYRLRLAVARTAPVPDVDAGVSVSTGDTSFFYRALPFAIRAR
ncbi:hypothetical protein ACWCP6_24220 [Streptomyces sp. NPDC002004]